jgi:hypothetical protein
MDKGCRGDDDDEEEELEEQEEDLDNWEDDWDNDNEEEEDEEEDEEHELDDAELFLVITAAEASCAPTIWSTSTISTSPWANCLYTHACMAVLCCSGIGVDSIFVVVSLVVISMNVVSVNDAASVVIVVVPFSAANALS